MLSDGIVFKTSKKADCILESFRYRWPVVFASERLLLITTKEVRIFNYSYGTIEFKKMNIFIEEYNKGFWEKIIPEGTRSTLIEKIN